MSDQAFRSRQWWCLQVGNTYCDDQNYVGAMWFKLQCSSSVLSKLLLVQLATPSDLFLDPPCPEIDWEPALLQRSCERKKGVSLAESFCDEVLNGFDIVFDITFGNLVVHEAGKH